MSKESVEFLIPRTNEAQRQSQPTILHQKAYDYPFSQYNLFVECYNSDCNRLDDIELRFMKESELYRFIFQILAKPLGKTILAFSLTFLPILNLAFYVIIWKSLLLYNEAQEVFKMNLVVVQNPLQKMIYSPEVCEMMGRNHWFFRVHEKDIHGFAFDQQTIQQLRLRSDNGQIKFMVYDDTFQNYYRSFPKYHKLHVSWVIISTLLLSLFGILTYLVINFANKDEEGNIDYD